MHRVFEEAVRERKDYATGAEKYVYSCADPCQTSKHGPIGGQKSRVAVGAVATNEGEAPRKQLAGDVVGRIAANGSQAWLAPISCYYDWRSSQGSLDLYGPDVWVNRPVW